MVRASLAVCAALASAAAGCRVDGRWVDAGRPDAGSACSSCLTDSDCPGGGVCAQYGGDSYCADPCASGSCLDTSSCMTLSTSRGEQARVCIPLVDPCGAPAQPEPDAGGPAASGMCGPLAAPTTAAQCTCGAGMTCAPNGCYGGWWCNTETNRCQQPPSPSSCSPDGGTGATFDAGPHPAPIPLPRGTVTGTGAALSELRFAIVGDTRPASPDDTPGYPSPIIARIWADVQSEAPPFAVTTGDYIFATPGRGQVEPQLDLYLDARAGYAGWVFFALGNHECNGRTASNCGPGNPDGVTDNYQGFLARMAATAGATEPFFTARFSAADGSWTAKFVFIAANAWTDDQGTWLDAELSKPTTYTFVVRHESSKADEAPGVTPSAQIMAMHPYTLLLAGHTHTFDYHPGRREVIVGNGGAPISGSVNYGYVIASRRADGAIHFAAKDYVTRTPFREFSVNADGTPAP
jgi:calcineurin-like phosphoesterase family protein